MSGLRLTSGVAKVRCGGCGTLHQSDQFAFGPESGRDNSYCESCAQRLVFWEERELVAALNSIDMCLYAVKARGGNKERVKEMIGVLRSGVDDIVSRLK